MIYFLQILLDLHEILMVMCFSLPPFRQHLPQPWPGWWREWLSSGRASEVVLHSRLLFLPASPLFFPAACWRHFLRAPHTDAGVPGRILFQLPPPHLSCATALPRASGAASPSSAPSQRGPEDAGPGHPASAAGPHTTTSRSAQAPTFLSRLSMFVQTGMRYQICTFTTTD